MPTGAKTRDASNGTTPLAISSCWLMTTSNASWIDQTKDPTQLQKYTLMGQYVYNRVPSRIGSISVTWAPSIHRKVQTRSQENVLTLEMSPRHTQGTNGRNLRLLVVGSKVKPRSIWMTRCVHLGGVCGKKAQIMGPWPNRPYARACRKNVLFSLSGFFSSYGTVRGLGNEGRVHDQNNKEARANSLVPVWSNSNWITLLSLAC